MSNDTIISPESGKNMNIEHLKTFKELSRLGSFSDVAKKLHISQPAVSFQVQRLEQELGVQLIDRSQRTAVLTNAGKRLLQFAETVEAEREKMQYDLEQMREEIAGELHITASTIPGEYILPGLLAKFKKMHPAVMVQVDVSDSMAVINGVRDNNYEAGFCGVTPEVKDLGYFKIADDEIVLIVPSEHPFANKSELTPDDLTGEPFIFRESTSGTQRSLENLLGKAGIDISILKPQLILGSTQAVISAVASGAGIAFISSLAIKNDCSPSIKQVPVRGLRLKRDFYYIFRRDKTVSRLFEEFRNFVQLTNTQ
jgi:DNA-binding transcriptional LysR family regulator